ncbi:hypothetical protein K7432_010516 [Basidiobolus ranarum]|uniref:SEC7 domain-containing protein n=1 Tax=Basidiobolus ranarum TaxID=34480 RepID=A0ABR2WNU7_9FUNG
MEHFNFTGMKLEQAFRFFCSHLLLHGESQIIDRILYAFAERYWVCNRDRSIPDRDILYTIVYSVLLLNTDLHVAQNHHKISKNEFVKNTLATIKASLTIRRSRATEENENTSELSSLNSFHEYSDMEQASVYSLSSKTSFGEESLTEILKGSQDLYIVPFVSDMPSIELKRGYVLGNIFLSEAFAYSPTNFKSELT